MFGSNFTGRSRQHNLSLASDRVSDRATTLANVRALREAREKDAKLRNSSRILQSAARGFLSRVAFLRHVQSSISNDSASVLDLTRMWLVISLSAKERGLGEKSQLCLSAIQMRVLELLSKEALCAPQNVCLLGKVLFSNLTEKTTYLPNAIRAFTQVLSRLSMLNKSAAHMAEKLSTMKNLASYALMLQGDSRDVVTMRCSLTLLSASLFTTTTGEDHGEAAHLMRSATLAMLLLLSDEVSARLFVDPFAGCYKCLLAPIGDDFWTSLTQYVRKATLSNEEGRIRVACRLLEMTKESGQVQVSISQRCCVWETVNSVLIDSPQRSARLGQYLLNRRWGRDSSEAAEEEKIAVCDEVLNLGVFPEVLPTDPSVSSLHVHGLSAVGATIRACMSEIHLCEAELSRKLSASGSVFHPSHSASLLDVVRRDDEVAYPELKRILKALKTIDLCCSCFISPWLALTSESSLQSNKRRRAVPLLSMIAGQLISLPDGTSSTLVPILWSALESLADSDCKNAFMGGRFGPLLFRGQLGEGNRFKAALPNISLLFLNLFSFYAQSTDFSGDLISGRIPLSIRSESDALGHVLALLASLKETVLISHLQGCECSVKGDAEKVFTASTGLTSSTVVVAQSCYRLLTALHVVDESSNYVERILLPWQKTHGGAAISSSSSSSSSEARSKNDWWAVPSQRYTFPAVVSYDDWTELTRLGDQHSETPDTHSTLMQVVGGDGAAEGEADAQIVLEVQHSSTDDEPSTLAAERARFPRRQPARGRAHRANALVSKMKNVTMENSSGWGGTQKVMMLLQHCPFLIPFANRVSIFSSLIYADRQRSGGGFRTHHFSSEVIVERGRSFVDAYNQLKSVPVEGLRGSLPVRFYRGSTENSSNSRSDLLSTSGVTVGHPSIDERMEEIEEDLAHLREEAEEMDDPQHRAQLLDMIENLQHSRDQLEARIPQAASGVRRVRPEDLEQGYGDGVQRDFINELCQDGFGSVRGLFAEAVGVDVTSAPTFGTAEPDARVVGVFPNSLLPNLLQRDDATLQKLLQQRQLYTNMGSERDVQEITTSINKHIQRINDVVEDQYRFLGSMVGKALRDGVLLDVSFAHFFRNLLLGRVNGVSDVASYDLDMYRSFTQLRTMACEELYSQAPSSKIDDLELRFTVSTQRVSFSDMLTAQRGGAEADGTAPDDERGMDTIEVPLLPGGENIPVTASNLPMYLHLVADYRLNKSIRRFSDAFRRGLYSLVDPSWLRLFDARELHILFCGGDEGMVGLDVSDWQQNTTYSGELFNPAADGLTPEEVMERNRRAMSGIPTLKNLLQSGSIGSSATRTIGMFWDVVAHDFTPHQQRLMLKFATSLSRAPLLGFGFMNPAFNVVLLGGDTERLPSAATCMCMLRLPQYPTRAVMKDKLLKAIEGTNTFEMS